MLCCRWIPYGPVILTLLYAAFCVIIGRQLPTCIIDNQEATDEFCGMEGADSSVVAWSRSYFVAIIVGLLALHLFWTSSVGRLAGISYTYLTVGYIVQGVDIQFYGNSGTDDEKGMKGYYILKLLFFLVMTFASVLYGWLTHVAWKDIASEERPRRCARVEMAMLLAVMLVATVIIGYSCIVAYLSGDDVIVDSPTDEYPDDPSAVSTILRRLNVSEGVWSASYSFFLISASITWRSLALTDIVKVAGLPNSRAAVGIMLCQLISGIVRIVLLTVDGTTDSPVVPIIQNYSNLMTAYFAHNLIVSLFPKVGYYGNFKKEDDNGNVYQSNLKPISLLPAEKTPKDEYYGNIEKDDDNGNMYRSNLPAISSVAAEKNGIEVPSAITEMVIEDESTDKHDPVEDSTLEVNPTIEKDVTNEQAETTATFSFAPAWGLSAWAKKDTPSLPSPLSLPRNPPLIRTDTLASTVGIEVVGISPNDKSKEEDTTLNQQAKATSNLLSILSRDVPQKSKQIDNETQCVQDLEAQTGSDISNPQSTDKSDPIVEGKIEKKVAVDYVLSALSSIMVAKKGDEEMGSQDETALTSKALVAPGDDAAVVMDVIDPQGSTVGSEVVEISLSNIAMEENTVSNLQAMGLSSLLSIISRGVLQQSENETQSLQDLEAQTSNDPSNPQSTDKLVPIVELIEKKLAVNDVLSTWSPIMVAGKGDEEIGLQDETLLTSKASVGDDAAVVKDGGWNPFAWMAPVAGIATFVPTIVEQAKQSLDDVINRPRNGSNFEKDVRHEAKEIASTDTNGSQSFKNDVLLLAKTEDNEPTDDVTSPQIDMEAQHLQQQEIEVPWHTPEDSTHSSTIFSFCGTSTSIPFVDSRMPQTTLHANREDTELVQCCNAEKRADMSLVKRASLSDCSHQGSTVSAVSKIDENVNEYTSEGLQRNPSFNATPTKGEGENTSTTSRRSVTSTGTATPADVVVEEEREPIVRDPAETRSQEKEEEEDDDDDEREEEEEDGSSISDGRSQPPKKYIVLLSSNETFDSGITQSETSSFSPTIITAPTNKTGIRETTTTTRKIPSIGEARKGSSYTDDDGTISRSHSSDDDEGGWSERTRSSSLQSRYSVDENVIKSPHYRSFSDSLTSASDNSTYVEENPFFRAFNTTLDSLMGYTHDDSIDRPTTE